MKKKKKGVIISLEEAYTHTRKVLGKHHGSGSDVDVPSQHQIVADVFVAASVSSNDIIH